MEASANLAIGVLSVRFAKVLEELNSIWPHNHRRRDVAALSREQLAPSNEISSSGGSLPRVNVEDLTGDEFDCRYSKARQPVMLLGAAQGWRALQRWSSQEELLKHYGDVPFKITERGACGSHTRLELPLRLYVQHAEAVAADSPFYIFERDLDGPRKPLMEDFDPPSFFQDDLYNTTEYTRAFLPMYRYYVIGIDRTGSNLHTDPCCTSAWNTLLCGLKRWVLFPPNDSEAYRTSIGAVSKGMDTGEQVPAYWWLDVLPRLKASGAAESLGMIECVQRPGETIFVPSGWWHAVLNIGFTAAVTQNLLAPSALDYAWPGLAAEWPDFAPRFARLLSSLRPDVRLPEAARAAAAADGGAECAPQSIEAFVSAWMDVPLPCFGLPGALHREVELCEVAQGLQARGNAAVDRHRSHREAVQWYGEALALLNDAAAVGPGSGALEAEIRASRAKCYLELGLFTDALLDCEALACEVPMRLAFATASVQSKAFRYMALALLALGREDDARAGLQRAIDMGLSVVSARKRPPQDWHGTAAQSSLSIERASDAESEEAVECISQAGTPWQSTLLSTCTGGKGMPGVIGKDLCASNGKSGANEGAEADGKLDVAPSDSDRHVQSPVSCDHACSPAEAVRSNASAAGELVGKAKGRGKGKNGANGKGKGVGKGKPTGNSVTKSSVRQSLARLLRELKAKRTLEGAVSPGQLPVRDFLALVARGCREHRTEEVRNALLQGACRVDARDAKNSDQNALRIALDLGSSEMVETLLELQAAPHQRYRHLVTPLMLAVKKGSSRIAQALLRHRASPHPQDMHGRTALHLACEARECGDSSRGEPRVAPDQRAAAVVTVLLQGRADVNHHAYEGQTPLHLAAMRDDWPLAVQLLGAGARFGAHHHSLGFAVCSLARRGAPDSEAACSLREAAQRSDAWPREAASLQAEAWWRLMEERLRPAAQAQAEAMTEVPRLKALAAALFGAAGLRQLPVDSARGEGANQLLAVHQALVDGQMPDSCKRLWTDADEASEDDVMAIMVATGRRPLAKHASGRTGASQEAFRELVFTPLTRCFSFAVPDDAVLDCITEHSPLVEMGAGSGYWAALLEARGCDIVAYDVKPPTLGESVNDTAYHAYVDVRYGEPEDLAQHSHRSLMLVWPMFAAADGAQSSSAEDWDAACLAHYKGSTVIHVGEWAGSGAFPGASQTTSVAFQRQVQGEFDCIHRMQLPHWPQVRDCLTVWRRRQENTEAS